MNYGVYVSFVKDVEILEEITISPPDCKINSSRIFAPKYLIQYFYTLVDLDTQV